MRCDFIIIDSTQARFRCLSSTDIYTSGITAGNWHHLAFTFDGSDIRAYTDGVLKNTLSHTAGGSTGSLAIDIAQNNFASSHGEFLMDDLGFWDGRTLTATEIQALANQGATTNTYKPSTMVIRSSDVYDPSSQTNQLDGLFFKPDGLKMYTISND